MNQVDKQYFELVDHILYNGVQKLDRTGTGTKSVFDYTMRFNMSDGFPILTSKRVYFKGVVHELLWFLGNHMNDEKYRKFGLTNIKYLIDNNVNIWVGDSYKNFKKSKDYLPEITKEKFVELIKNDELFAIKHGDLGRIYGAQWTHWKKTVELDPTEHDFCYINQIEQLISDLKTNPDSRRLLVSAWNVGELDEMILPPCHFCFQCYTRDLTLDERIELWTSSLGKSISYGNDMYDIDLDAKGIPRKKLSLKWTMRSIDVPLGLPYNIASYGLLLHLLAKEVNMLPDELIFSGGDAHIYLNQIDGIKQQLHQQTFNLPSVIISNKSIFNIEYGDIELNNYTSSEAIKIPLSN